jgi:hypothetical protein
MERLAQYLDDLEDIFFALALAGERLLSMLRALLVVCLAVTMPVLGVLLALHQPPFALAAVSLLAVLTLYRAAVGDRPRTVVRT